MEYKLLSKLYYSEKTKYEEVYNERFNSEYTCVLDFYIGDNQAFFVQLPQIFKSIVNIERTNKRIGEISMKLPGVAIGQFAKKSLIDEIVLTNNIEGVYSTRKEIMETLEELGSQNKRNRFKGLVNKYIMLSHSDIGLDKCEDIRKIYDELVLEEVVHDDPKNQPDGKIFRKESVSVNNAAQKEIHRGLYPEEKIIKAMSDALAVVNDENIDLLIRISLFHYMFGYIHPFYEGNGRTSRFISSYLLSKEYEGLIGYRISYTIKENINKYYEAFKICNDEKNKGDLTPFVLMFLNIMEISFRGLEKSLENLLAKLKFYLQHMERLPNYDKKNKDIYSLLIQASLFSENGISTSDLMEGTNLSRSTLSKRLDKAKKMLIIKTRKNTKYYMLNLEEFDKLIG